MTLTVAVGVETGLPLTAADMFQVLAKKPDLNIRVFDKRFSEDHLI